MKTKIVYGMIALLSVSLFFFGCDTGTGSDSSSRPDPTWPPTTGGGSSAPSDTQAAQVLASDLNEKIGGNAIYAKGDEVFIPNGTIVPVGGAAIPSLEIPSGVKLTVHTGGILRLDDGIPGGPADSNEDAKLLTINGTLEVFGQLLIDNASIGTANTAPFVVPSRGTLILSANFAPIDIVNNGTLTLAAGTPLDYAAGSNTIANNGTLTVTGESTELKINAAGFTNAPGSVINVTDAGSGGIEITDAVPYANSVTINVDGGTFSTAGAFTNTGTINLTIDGSLDVASDLTNNGTIAGGGLIEVTGDLANNSIINVGDVTVSGEIANNGTFTIAGATSTAATLTNAAGKTITVADGGDLTVASGITGNAGTIIASGAINVTTAGITNTGTVTVNGGGAITVTAGGFANTGNVTVADDGELTVTAGVFANNANGANNNSITVEGTLTITEDSVTHVTVRPITVDGGTLALPTGGIDTFTGPDGKVTVKNGGRVKHDTTFIIGSGGKFEPTNTAVVSFVSPGASAVYTVEAGNVALGANFAQASDGTIKVTGGSNPVAALLINGKTLTLTSSAGLTGTAGAVVNNTGTPSTIVNPAANIFFDNTEASIGPGNLIEDGIYTWTGTLNSGTGGWKRDS